jgi:PBSX family phage terminase large subunit
MTFTSKQNEFLSDLDSKICAFVGGFGSGKTYAACYKAFLLSGINYGTAGMLVSPTYGMLRDTTRRTFLEMLEQNEVGFNFKATENKITINEFGSEIWFRSADDPNKLKGANLSWVGLDEPALMHKDAYLISLSRIRDNKAKVLQLFLTGTPEGFNWLYDELVENIDGTKRLIRASTEENIYIPKEYVQSLYQNYDEQLVKQYINGEFVLLDKGQVYYAFNRLDNLNEDGYNPNYPIMLSVDFNVNPMSWAVIQQKGQIIQVIDEIVLKNSNTEYASLEYRRRYPNAETYIYGDYSGTQKHTSSMTTDYKIMQDIIKPIDIRIKPNPLVINRINAVNAKLKNAKGERFLFINKNCKHLIRDLEQVIYKDGKREIDKSNLDLSHISDALGYYVEYEFGLKGKNTSKIGIYA